VKKVLYHRPLQQASYVVSRHRFNNDASSSNDVGKKRTTAKTRKDFDDDFFDEFDIDDVDFDAPSDAAELQRATTLTNPVVPLEFGDSAKKRPKKKNLNRRRLMKKMGVDFDPTWMSPEAPHSTASRDSVAVVGENQVSTPLNLFLRLLQYKGAFERCPPPLGYAP
jgi:hypothetical protein